GRRPAATRRQSRPTDVWRASRAVFPIPDGGEDPYRIGNAPPQVFVDRIDHRRLAAAKEGIGRPLFAERAGEGRLAGVAQFPVSALARLQRRVVRLDGLCEADIR